MVAISSQMSANLVSLMSVNEDMARVQDRLSTGKKVNSVLDGAATYFRAQTLTEKAEAFDPVNANINAALSNVKVADKAINTIYDNLTGLLSSMRDARSKAITATAVAATNNANASTYNAGSVGTAANQSLVDTSATPAFADPTRMQVGDVIAFSFTDATNNTVTRYFRATTAADVGVTGGAAGTMTSGTGSGNNAANAINFSSAADLVTAFTGAFGRDDIQLSLDTGTGRFSVQAAALGTSFSIAQVVNAGAAPAGTTNTTIDLERMFGTSANIVRTGGNGATISNGANAAATAVSGTMITVSGTGSAASAANLETRRLVAETYRATLLQLNNIARDAYMPGFVNLLQGGTMTVDLNEDAGDVVQNVSIGGAVDALSLGFTGFSTTTGNDNQSTTNFATDPTLDAAITRVSTAMTTLRSRQGALANHTTMLSTRLQFNKDFQTIVGDAATAITAADANEEAASMAALQNRQAYAMNNLSVTKNAEQSLLQLLR